MIADDDHTKLHDVIKMPDYTKNPFDLGDYEFSGFADLVSLPDY